MNIQGFQKLSLLDYPGKVACTVFTGGCNLRCPFCHNAGLVKTPTASANMKDDVLSYLSSRKGLLDGVCVTGGEPLIQPDIEDFLKTLKDLGYSVKLDTNGSFPEKLRRILKSGAVDYVAMDIKSSPETYSIATGSDTDFEVFAESIRIIKESGIPHEFRTTAVKGIHTSDDFEKIGRLIGDEAYYIQCFIDSGNLIGDGCSAFTPEEMMELRDAARLHTPKSQLRGMDQ